MRGQTIDVNLGGGGRLISRIDQLSGEGLKISNRTQQAVSKIRVQLPPPYERDYRKLQRVEETVAELGFSHGTCYGDGKKQLPIRVECGFKPFLYGCWDHKEKNLHVQAADGRNGNPRRGIYISGREYSRAIELEQCLRKMGLRRDVVNQRRPDDYVLFGLDEPDIFACYLQRLLKKS